MSVKRILLGLVICISISAPVFAVPSLGWWERGMPGTTYQKWTFEDNDNNAIPEMYNNLYGPVRANMSTTPDGLLGWMTNYLDRSGVWVGIPSLDIELSIPNVDYPYGHKVIWLEMDFRAEPDSDITVSGLAGESVVQVYDNIEIVDPYNGWKKWTAAWDITPNPNGETILIHLAGSGGQIDYVEVDTICIPAPGAFLLSTIGVGLVSWFRRRSIP